MMKDIVSTVPVLVALIVVNIAAGTLNSSIKKEDFSKERMIKGILKGIIAIACIFALAYAFDTIDLSGVGFSPATMVTSGIAIYAVKVAVNMLKLVGLSDYIKIKNPTPPPADSTLEKVVKDVVVPMVTPDHNEVPTPEPVQAQPEEEAPKDAIG